MSTCIWRQEKFETGHHVQHLLTNAPTTGGYPKSGTSKIALFLDILSNLAMKGPQMWPKSIMTCKYYQKCPLEKKMREFRAPGAEIWLFKKKNMDCSIDHAVQHMSTIWQLYVNYMSTIWHSQCVVLGCFRSVLLSQNIARGPTDPGIASITWISYKFGHQMVASHGG